MTFTLTERILDFLERREAPQDSQDDRLGIGAGGGHSRPAHASEWDRFIRGQDAPSEYDHDKEAETES
jgi:hypothetical protein